MNIAAAPGKVGLVRTFARDDFLAGLITVAATLMFVFTASRATGQLLHGLYGMSGGADQVAATALILNVALILFAWRRHKDAKRAVLEKALAERRAQMLRTRDPQTNLLNRNSLRDRGGAMIENAREHRANVALMVVNLNRFKKINEVYGDGVGDGLLRIIAGVILGTAPKDAICARLGSDEFAIAIPFENSAEDKVATLAEELLAQLNRPVELMSATIQISAAIGLSHLGFDCMDFSSLMRRADIAMNAAKDKGGDKPLWFDAQMERSLRARNEVEVGLQRGIPLGEFVPYYQPVVEFKSGRIRGFEMLARWHHPAGGVVEPDLFIPVAEETGLIGALSEALMRAAFEEARQWDPSLSLAVNISPSQLTDPWLPHKVLKLLTDTGFPAERLELEITESSLVENLEVAQATVASLKNLGIRLSLDDFGTGYSSLAHLRALPFDRIKIDRSFVLTLNKQPESWTIVKTIANLGASLGIPVTIEGVESAAIELRLRGLGCELGQGWFYGHATTGALTRQLLMEHGLCPPAKRSNPDETAPREGPGSLTAEAA